MNTWDNEQNQEWPRQNGTKGYPSEELGIGAPRTLCVECGLKNLSLWGAIELNRFNRQS